MSASRVRVTQALWAFIKEHKWKYITVATCVSILTMQRIVIPHYYGVIVASIQESNIEKATNYFFILNGCWILFQILGGFASLVDASLNPRLHNYLRSWFVDIIMQSSTHDVEVGNLLAKSLRFPSAVYNFFELIQEFVIGNFLTVIATCIYLYQMHPSLGIYFFVIYMINVGLAILFQKGCLDLSKAGEAMFDESSNEIEDVLSNLQAIHGSRTQGKESSFLRNVFEHLNKHLSGALRCQFPYRIGFVILGSLSLIGINIQSLNLLKQTKITTASLVSIFIASYSALSVIMNTYSIFREVLQAGGRMTLVYEFLDTLELLPLPNNDATKTQRIPPKIVMQDLLIEPGIRRPVNITIPPLSRVLIKGPIGSGKSTLGKGLAGLISLSGGKIVFDGRVTDATQRRRNVFYVPQMPNLFRRSLWDNITYGVETPVSKGRIFDILKRAGLSEIAQRFSDNLERNVGRRGNKLSGGERQIVWLLRAALRDQPILVLDEPSAALDNDSTLAVERLINTLSRTRTIIVVSHDQAFLEGWASQLVRLVDGGI